MLSAFAGSSISLAGPHAPSRLIGDHRLFVAGVVGVLAAGDTRPCRWTGNRGKVGFRVAGRVCRRLDLARRAPHPARLCHGHRRFVAVFLDVGADRGAIARFGTRDRRCRKPKLGFLAAARGARRQRDLDRLAPRPVDPGGGHRLLIAVFVRVGANAGAISRRGTGSPIEAFFRFAARVCGRRHGHPDPLRPRERRDRELGGFGGDGRGERSFLSIARARFVLGDRPPVIGVARRQAFDLRRQGRFAIPAFDFAAGDFVFGDGGFPVLEEAFRRRGLVVDARLQEHGGGPAFWRPTR